MTETQNYQNHTRWYPLQHFVLTPMLIAFLIYTIVQMVRFPNVDRTMLLFLALALAIQSLVARLYALRVQDRLIRLEEKLRYEKVLPKDLAEKTIKLKTSQMIALRFASGEELPELVQKTLNGDFEKPKDIKLAVKNWRGDYLRV
ncbi:MAG: DUF6526 family protein [Acidobacteriota bacterium]|nr:DUF6526 family protein [Acidobacteriota bacterium]